MDKDYTGTDKLKHLAVCLVASILHPFFALGLALGKEYGDKNATGNHWCWWDIVSDVVGIAIGTVGWWFLFYPINR